jgi:nicotinamide mononucleotide transporter
MTLDALLAPFDPWLQPVFTLWGGPVTGLELVAFVLSVAMVVGNMRVKPWAWPLAIAASALYGVLFASAKLYAEAGLQLVFIALALWGWWQWLRGRDEHGAALRVRALPRRTAWGLALLCALAWPALALSLAHGTDSDVPWFDSLPTVGSLAGQWLLGRQYVANWPVWVAVNLVSVALFVHKALWLTALLYALFTLMALWGWKAWAARAAARA